MQSSKDRHPFEQVLEAVRKSIHSTDLKSAIKALSKEVDVKLSKKENIEALHISKEFAKAQLSLSHLNCTPIENSIHKIPPFPKQIYYCHLFDLDRAAMIAIFLPQGLEFSLHNHPSMLVFTKPLLGKLLVDSMDIHTDENSNLTRLQTPKPTPCCGLCENSQAQGSKNGCQDNHQKQNGQGKGKELDHTQNIHTPNQPELWKFPVHLDYPPEKKEGIHHTFNFQRKIITNKQLSVASPERGNIHRLEAVTDCLFLDILIPDYDEQPKYYEYCGQQKPGSLPLIREIPEPKQLELLVSLDP